MTAKKKETAMRNRRKLYHTAQKRPAKYEIVP